MQVASQTHTGCVREHNEDCLAVRQELGLLVLADGMGGHAAGEVAIAFGSMAAKRPFTLAYAKQHVPQELWNHPRFLRKNYLITGAWGVSFLFCLALAVLELNGHGPGKLLVEILDDGSMLAAMVFTKFLTRHPTTAETPA